MVLINGALIIRIAAAQTADEKSSVCNRILRSLPNWFGVETSIVNYVREVREMPLFAAYRSDNQAVGFVALKTHTAYASEVHVMGIIEEYHRQGIGRALIQQCVGECLHNGQLFLTVKTLDSSRESKSYEKTRLFYQSMGFYPLEVFPLFWDEDNPCLFMAKHLANTV